jgi:uncharacterized phage protein (TIGR01671 family)
MSNYRFNELSLRAWNKTEKKMYYSDANAIMIYKGGFTVMPIEGEGDARGIAIEKVVVSENDGVLMSGIGYRDKNANWIYEGDIVFMRRQTKKGLFPIIGLVQGRDFTFSVAQGRIHYSFDYADRDLEVLGNIFEHSDEELAKKSEELLKKYELKV